MADAVFEGEDAGSRKKKIVAVYKRRGKNRSLQEDDCGNSKRRSWIDRCLSSRPTSVILNSQRGRREVPKIPCALQNEHQRKRVVAPAPPADFIREKQAHFAEVDAFELQEESPPKTHIRWQGTAAFDDLRRARNGHLEAVLEEFPGEASLTPEDFLSAALKTPPVRAFLRAAFHSKEANPEAEVHEEPGFVQEKPSAEDLITDLESLSISKSRQTLVFDEKEFSPAVSISVFDLLLQDSFQESPMSLAQAFSEFCNMKAVVKIGEGTYGEAYKANGNVFKVVPMDGSFKINGELQKTSSEIYGEVLLSNTLNKLRDRNSSFYCSTFVETKATRICQGKYDKDLLRAWKKWDAQHDSENDQPLEFPPEQLYIVFVLEDGGTDLESFELLDYNEVRSLLLQVVLSLAVAEQAYGFEHRDLHWGNIVLSRNKQEELDFRLDGRDLLMTTYGLSVSLIDFTLSRIDTGKQVVYCDLSDPSWFEGPKGDAQAETYRRMREVTNGRWEESFPKNNSLWIHYVAEIIRKKKTFKCSAKDKRTLSAFAKRALQYESATETILDKIFEDMWK